MEAEECRDTITLEKPPMSQVVQAIYEGGIFRPLAPLALPEHTQVTLDVRLAASGGNEGTPRMSPEEFERELAELISSDGPPLPADFSRADIYADHD